MNRMRVLIIDDHERVRSALLCKLRREQDLEVIGTAASVEEDLEEALKFRPDVVLLDVKRIDGRGTEICRQIVHDRPETRVLILTSYPDEREKWEVQAIGAAGYLLKDLDVHDLLWQIKVPQDGKGHGNSGEGE